LHVPDYNDPLVTVTDILNRLRSILEKWLLTPKQLWRSKNYYWLSPDDTIDVWSPLLRWSRWDDPKQILLNIVDDIWTSVTLLLSVSHCEFWNYPHSITWAQPTIKGLILSKKHNIFLLFKEFTSWLLSLSQEFNIPVLDWEGNIVDLAKVESENQI
jgi:hypothetical protein